MGIFKKGSKKAGPRELGDDELPSAINDQQPSTPKQRRLWRGRSQQKVSEDVSPSETPAETDLQAAPAQKKRGLFGRKKDKQGTLAQDGTTLERTSSIEDGSTKGRKGKAKKEKAPPPAPPRVLTEAEAAEAAENQRRAIDSIRNVHYNPENAIYNWEPTPVDTGVSAAPNVNDGAISPASNTRAGKLKGMFKPGKKASSAPTRSTAGLSSSPQVADDQPDVITNTATPDKTSKFGGMFRRSKSKDKERDSMDIDDIEQGTSTAGPAESLTPARSKGVFGGGFGKFGKGSKSKEPSPAKSMPSEGVQMSNQSAFSSQQQSPEAMPPLHDMQQDFNTREYLPVHANPIHSISKDQLHTDRYDPAGLGANYTGEEPGTYR